MPIRQRHGVRPSPIIADPDATSPAERRRVLAKVTYAGAGYHKLRPGDYNFTPTHSPRPSKSVCDDLRPVSKAEAKALFALGIERGMTSVFPSGGVPKYVWAVDEAGEPYEAKTKPERETQYHGYRLGDDKRDRRRMVLREWKRRCPKI